MFQRPQIIVWTCFRELCTHSLLQQLLKASAKNVLSASAWLLLYKYKTCSCGRQRRTNTCCLNIADDYLLLIMPCWNKRGCTIIRQLTHAQQYGSFFLAIMVRGCQQNVRHCGKEEGCWTEAAPAVWQINEQAWHDQMIRKHPEQLT